MSLGSEKTVKAGSATRTEGTRFIGGGLSSGAVATLTGLPTAKGSIDVVEVAELRIHESMDIKQGFVTVPDRMTAVTAVQK